MADQGTVLIVHSDRNLRASAREVLERLGAAVREAPEGADPAILEALPAADLMLLEWRGRDAIAASLAICRRRNRHSRVIVLAPESALREAVLALELGAEDCLRVPFEEEELSARAAAALRRPRAAAAMEPLAGGPIVLDKTTHGVLIGGRAVELAPTEFRLLAFFLENQERVFSRLELLRRAWTKDLRESQQRTVDVHVRRLRQVLEPFRCAHMIQTVRGFGYRFSPRGAASASPVERPFAIHSRTS
jgi:two-component system phosphate regulon response regulator PhoB